MALQPPAVVSTPRSYRTNPGERHQQLLRTRQSNSNPRPGTTTTTIPLNRSCRNIPSPRTTTTTPRPDRRLSVTIDESFIKDFPSKESPINNNTNNQSKRKTQRSPGKSNSNSKSPSTRLVVDQTNYGHPMKQSCKIRSREMIGLVDLSFDEKIIISSKEKKVSDPIHKKPSTTTTTTKNKRCQSAPSRRPSPRLSSSALQDGTEHNSSSNNNNNNNNKPSFAKTMQRAREMATKSVLDARPCRNPLDDNIPEDNNNAGRFFSCGGGGGGRQGVGSRFADCLLVTAEVYEQEFGTWSKEDNDNNNNKEANVVVANTTMSTENTSFESDPIIKDIERNNSMAASILPQSTISGSNSSGSTISPRYSDSNNKRSTNDNNNNNKSRSRPPRVLKISTAELIKHDEAQRRYHTTNQIDSSSPIKNSDRYLRNEYNNHNIPRSSNHRVSPPSYSTPSPRASNHESSRQIISNHIRRPRGSYSSKMGDEIPFDENSVHARNPVHNTSFEHESLRSVRLDMYHHTSFENQNLSSSQHDEQRYRRTNERVLDNEMDLANEKIRLDPKQSRQQTTTTPTPTMENNNQAEELYKNALRDLEAQDQIIQNLLSEYERTKQILTKTQLELEASRSLAVQKQQHEITTKVSAGKVQEWLETEDKLISEMNTNRSLLKKLADLKQQTKHLKGWLSNPVEAVSDDSITSLPKIPGLRGESSSPKGSTTDLTEKQIESGIDDNAGSEVLSSGSSVVPSEHDAIARLQAEIAEARANRLATVERLINLNKGQSSTEFDTKALQRRLEKLKKDRQLQQSSTHGEETKDKRTTAPSTTALSMVSQTDDLELLQNEITKLTKGLLMSNNSSLCTVQRRKASNMAEELHNSRSEASNLRSQVEALLRQLRVSKQQHDEKSVGADSCAKVLQDEINRIKLNLSIDSSH